MKKGGGEKCEHCGLAYNDLRTGETYKSVREMLWSGSDDSSTWVYKRRNTVLGKWHEIKLVMWGEHLELCQRQADWLEDEREKSRNIQFLEPSTQAFMVPKKQASRYACDEVPF